VVTAGATGELDISAEGRIQTRFIGEVHQQLALLRSEPGWTLAALVNWIDGKIWHPDITRTQATLFIQKAVAGLAESHGVAVEQLARQRYKLRDAVAAKVDEHRHNTVKNQFDMMLFGSGADDFEVTPDACLEISEGRYAPRWYYEGGHQWRRHAFKTVGELKSEGEEFECARYIDNLEQVKRWVRNIERSDASFWLQTSTDKFYPDFVAELADGRILVIEYKGEDRWSNDDSKEKRAVGDFWAERSKGQCLFVMPRGDDMAAIRQAVAGRTGVES
jgi:type III restriction enzyme